MYAKCGRIHKAWELFDKMHDVKIVSWFVIVAGCIQNGLLEKTPKRCMQNVEKYTRIENYLTICMMQTQFHVNLVSWSAMVARYT